MTPFQLMHEAKKLPKEEFKRKVGTPTGKETEPWRSFSSSSTRASCR